MTVKTETCFSKIAYIGCIIYILMVAIGGWNLIDPEDLPVLESFNKRHCGNETMIQGQLLPEPFIGDPDRAKLLFLALNPGYAGQEDALHGDPKFIKLIMDNITGNPREYPYYYLHMDSCFDLSPGHVWCKRVFKDLLREVPADILAKKICCFQFHGYHSKKYYPLGKSYLASQLKTFEQIRRMMDRGILIVLMRSKRIWFEALPQLATYTNFIQLRNPRNPTISRGNMNVNDFDKMLRALK